MALLEISIVPMGLSTPGIGDYIADIVKTCDDEKVQYRLTDMGTIIEGESDTLFLLARKLHELPFKKGIQRVLTNISIDDRRDKRVGIDDKVNSILSRLKRET